MIHSISEYEKSPSSHSPEKALGYASTRFNLRQKIENDREDIHHLEEDDIDDIFPQTLEQHSNRIDSWRSYNSDLDKTELSYDAYKQTNCRALHSSPCCSDGSRTTSLYFTWPFWWMHYQAPTFCC